MVFLRKVPWGIVAGISAMAVVFATVAFVGLYLVLGGVAGQTNEAFGMFEEWYQVLLFVADILFALAFIGSVIMYVLKKSGRLDNGLSCKEIGVTEENDEDI